MPLGHRLVHYVLLGQTPVACPDLMEWAQWYDKADRVVFQTSAGPYLVSTVFLGLDHNWSGRGEPVLFETMIFVEALHGEGDISGESLEEWSARHRAVEALHDQELLHYQERYTSWLEAEEGHARAILEARASVAAEEARYALLKGTE